jgi:hypothetical protein
LCYDHNYMNLFVHCEFLKQEKSVMGDQLLSSVYMKTITGELSSS